MNKNVLLLSLSLLAASATFASPIAYNTEEFRLSGYLDLDSAAGTQYSLELGYGYFFMDYVQAGGFAGYSDDDLQSDLYAGAFIEYNFETNTDFIPFVGSQLRFVYANYDTAVEPFDDSSDAGALGLYLGCKYFITENLAVAIRVLGEVASDDIYAEENELNNTDVTIDFGLRYFN